MAKKEKKSGGSKKYGRNEAKCKAYRASKNREKNKIKRILQSEGLKAAELFAEKHEIWGVLRRLSE